MTAATFAPDRLREILAEHRAWLRGEGGKRANLSGANLSGANLSVADLSRANLSRANLSGANLSGADLSVADLSRADLSRANLSRAYLSGAYLSRAYLSGAYLSGADLSGAYLSGANLSGAVVADGIKATAAPHRRATRNDGYEFLLWHTDAGWRVRAGCRFLSMDDAWRHWEQTRAGTPLGDESHDILTMFELHIERTGA